MKARAPFRPADQHGMALVSAMLLLLVLTILGISMFRTFGTQEKIAGNTREKQRAIHTADSAEAYAEWWLSSQGGINASAGAACTDLITAGASTTQVCANRLSTTVPGGDVSVVPWTDAGTEVGVAYTPPGLVTTATGDSYYQVPRFYISFISSFYNSTTGVQSSSYLIDSAGWGGTPDAVSVVESTYIVNKMYTTQSKGSKYISLGGP
jgi:type IV pilus assembly protein PilX